MKRIKIIVMLFIVALMYVSCQNEDTINTETESKEDYPEIAAKLQKMHFSAEGLEIIDLELPNDTKQKMFEVESDMVFSKEHIENAAAFKDVKQYRTSSLVSTSMGWRGIKILGYSGVGSGAYGLSNKERIGLIRAVNNYNALNLKIRFFLDLGTDLAGKGIVVYHNPSKSGTGGQSGVPSAGNPYRWISVWGLNSFSYDFSEAMITHHIGHSIGMHHTNQSIATCGEVPLSVGRIPIPGTPWGDADSIYNLCLPLNTNGELSFYDKVALNYLY